MESNRPRINLRIHEWMASYSFIRENFVDGLYPGGYLRQAKINALRANGTGKESKQETACCIFASKAL